MAETLESKVNKMDEQRTKKEFEDYNEYHDRGFMKWVTAFTMDELTKGITLNHREAMKSIKLLPQMSEKEVNEVLSIAFMKHKPVRVQLNTKDHFGRAVECIEGYFLGQAYDNELVIGAQSVNWEEIRNIILIENKKWSEFDVFDYSTEDPFS
jgi:hypothetical protein